VSTWKEYRAKRNLALLVFPGAFPVGIAVMILLVEVRADYLWIPLSCAWMAVAWLLGLRVRQFRCPRCGERSSGTWTYNYLVRAVASIAA
jgi:hypothetical protein